MLRTAVLVLAGGLAAIGAWLWLKGLTVPGAQALGVGGVLALGILFERWRYRKNEPPATASWQSTGERFVDPATGKEVEVLYDPVSGERRYIER